MSNLDAGLLVTLACRSRLFLICAAALVAAGSAAAVAKPAPGKELCASGVAALIGLDNEIVVEINTVRAQHHLRPLRADVSLEAAAADHSREMVDGGYFGHASLDGTVFWKRITRFYALTGFVRWEVGETLLWSSPMVSAGEAVRDWLASPTHRRVLLAPG